MLILSESAAGYALFSVDDGKVKKADTEVRLSKGIMVLIYSYYRSMHAAMPGFSLSECMH